MSKAAKPSVTMSQKEQIWGFLYLLVELFVLPTALHKLNGLLPIPLSGSWLNFLYFSLNFIFTCYLFRLFLKRCLTHAGKNVGNFLLFTILGFGIYYVCNLAMGYVIRFLAPDFANLNDGSIAQLVGGNLPFMIIGTVILAPVAEELLHRGLVFGSLYSKHHAVAYVVSAVLFSAIHIMGYATEYSIPHLLLAFVQYLPAGLVLAWAYHKSGNIFSPILIHAAVNTMALLSLR